MESEDRGINRPVRGIPNVHVPRVSAGPDISGLSDNNSICGLCELHGLRVRGLWLVSWGMLTREELGLL